MKFPVDFPPAGRREILRRGMVYRREASVVVDYYRIRQKLFFPLPVEDFPEVLSTVRGIPNYPYAIWLLWQLEERIFTMGWAAEWDGRIAEVQRDLEALIRWKRFRQLPIPDLCSAHIAKILASSLTWRWLPSVLRRDIRAALRRVVDDGFPLLRPLPANSVPELIERGVRFPNIPTIGAMGLALAATQGNHPAASEAAEHAGLLAELWLEWGVRGHGEGVSYDGYTCDFLMDFTVQCPAPMRRKLLSHPRIREVLQEIRLLGAPGRPENLALLGDVEPGEMRFHYSFAAKFLARVESGDGFPFPAQPARHLRADALPHLRKNRTRTRPALGVHDAHYAVVLQPGRRVKAAVSWSNSQMGHMQPDYGSVVAGAGGNWLLDDPGYRQYLPTAEREFTLGARAHNHPVINGCAPSSAPEHRSYDVLQARAGAGIRLDLSSTYANWQGTCVREIRMDPHGRMTIEDHIPSGNVRRVDYHWHGHPSAAWHISDGWACLLGGKDSRIRFTCEGQPLQPQDLHRLRGSRGHLSIVKTLRFSRPRKSLRIRWLFEITSAGDPPLSSAGDVRWVNNRFFQRPGDWLSRTAGP